MFQDGSRRYLDFIVADRQSVTLVEVGEQAPETVYAGIHHAPGCTPRTGKPQVATQAFRTERRYCGTSNQMPRGRCRACSQRKLTNRFVMDRNVLVRQEISALRWTGRGRPAAGEYLRRG